MRIWKTFQRFAKKTCLTFTRSAPWHYSWKTFLIVSLIVILNNTINKSWKQKLHDVYLEKVWVSISLFVYSLFCYFWEGRSFLFKPLYPDLAPNSLISSGIFPWFAPHSLHWAVAPVWGPTANPAAPWFHALKHSFILRCVSLPDSSSPAVSIVS